MSNPSKYLLVALFCAFVVHSTAAELTNNSWKTDSLKIELSKADSDSSRARIADDISYEFYFTSIDSSLYYAKVAGAFAKKSNKLDILAQSHNYQGICYLSKASLMNALDQFQIAFDLYETIGDKRGEAKMLNNLGVIYTETEDYKRAVEKYELSYKLNDELGTWGAASNAIFNISASFFQMKEYDKSLEYANELRKYNKMHPDCLNPAALYGDIFKQKGQLDSAKYYMEISVADMEASGDLFNWSLSVIALAEVVLELGDPKKAEKILESTEKIIKDNAMIDAEFEYLSLKAKIYSALNMPALAYEYQSKALNLNDSLAHLNQMNMINDMNTKYETDRMESKISEQKDIIESKQVWLASIMAVAILLVCALAGVIYILKRNKKLNYLLKIQNQQINHQRQKIVSSINYAKRIQQSTLPKEEDFKKLFKDSFIYFKPKDIISGDFYAYQQIENKIYVAAVDCTGHGVPGAFMSLIANSKLNKVVNELGERDPGRILCSMHKEIQLSLHQENKEEHPMDGMEMSLCSIDLEKNTIEFAGAGSSIFIVRNGNIQEYKGSYAGIGGNDYLWNRGHDSMMFETQTISFSSDDMLFLFSDGMHDQIGGADLKKLNKSLFKNHLIHLSNNAMDHAVQGCEKFISDWRNNHQQTDDMMLIGIRL